MAFKDGQPTPAAQAFARKAGVGGRALEKDDAEGRVCIGYGDKGRPQRRGDPGAEAAEGSWRKIYWAKNMYWRAGKPERFVRPVRWMVALLDRPWCRWSLAGKAAGNVSLRTSRAARRCAGRDR